MNKYILYRISSKANQKPRIDGFSKWDCLDSLLSSFQGYKVVCVADNCDSFTTDQLKAKPFYKFVETSLGNAASFNYLLNNELAFMNDDDLVYFAEDDYYYVAGASKLLEEGLEYFDYVSLYDHPDKYGTSESEMNILVPEGKLSEFTQVVKGQSCVWRTTNSTTMTFGCLVKTIRSDLKIWDFFTKLTPIPRDFYIWLILICPQKNFLLPKRNASILLLLANLRCLFKRKRKLGVPIPSASAHVEVGMLPDNFWTDFREQVRAPQNNVAT